MNGAGFRDITRDPAADTNAALSPDGSQLAFWSDRSGETAVYLSRPDGTGLRRVRGNLDTRGQPPGPLSWSPDGTLLVVAVPRPHGGGGVRNELDVIDVQQARARSLVSNGCFTPEWSLDGQLIACSQAGEVVVLDRKGRRRFHCTGGDPMWSSNGLLAVSNGGTFVYDAQGTRVARFAGQPRAWSPDGSQLAVESGGALKLVGADGSNPRTLVRKLVPGTHRLIPDFVEFTPDGRSIAYDATGAGPKLVDVTGGPSVALPGPGSWSEDGARYAFVVDRADGTQVRVGNRTGGSSLLLALLPAGSVVERLLWAQDGRSILYDTEPPGQRPRALLDAARWRRVEGPHRRRARRARPGVVARRQHARLHVRTLCRTRLQGLRAHLAHRERRRDGVHRRYAARRRNLRQRRRLVAGRHDDRVRARHERHPGSPVHGASRRDRPHPRCRPT